MCCPGHRSGDDDPEVTSAALVGWYTNGASVAKNGEGVIGISV
jgi:hypothetical protein